MTDVEILLRQHAQSDNLDCNTTRFDWWLTYALSLHAHVAALRALVTALESKTEMEDCGISGGRLEDLMR